QPPCRFSAVRVSAQESHAQLRLPLPTGQFTGQLIGFGSFPLSLRRRSHGSRWPRAWRKAVGSGRRRLSVLRFDVQCPSLPLLSALRRARPFCFPSLLRSSRGGRHPSGATIRRRHSAICRGRDGSIRSVRTLTCLRVRLPVGSTRSDECVAHSRRPSRVIRTSGTRTSSSRLRTPRPETGAVRRSSSTVRKHLTRERPRSAPFEGSFWPTGRSIEPGSIWSSSRGSDVGSVGRFRKRPL